MVTEERAKRDSTPFAPPPVRHARPGPLETDVRYLRCPECSQPMMRMNFGRRSGVILDACKRHGTWFDAGELERVRDFVCAGGLQDEAHAHPQSPEGRGWWWAEASTSFVARRERAAPC
jgi:Zn-finger nucleic acid-binding protein